VLETSRLQLRRFSEDDRAPFARINADPRVMEFMPACLSRRESDLLFDRIEDHFRKHNFGLYAAELRETRAFIGFVGLATPRFEAHFTPCVEIGWRLSADHWGRGLATEGARAVASHAFEVLRLDALVSFTSTGNMRSRRVMEKIGMTRDASEDFDHPGLPEGHPLRRHVLYRLRKQGISGESIRVSG
jgi:ribosomal-protein-alanine N-acetyltransferase